VAAEEEAAREAAHVAEATAAKENEQHLVECLVSMGFSAEQAGRAIVKAQGNVEEAITILIEGDAEEPEQMPPAPQWDEEWEVLVTELVEMGFEEHLARAALTESEGAIKDAVKELVMRERAMRQSM